MNDFQSWYQILSDQETMQYYPRAFDMDKTRSWIGWNLDNYSRYGFGLWAIILKETNQFIEDCGITMQNIHGDGNLFPEAAKACLRYAFENMDFDEIFSYQKWTNIPSRKVAEKVGMTLREEYADEKNKKTSVYSITRTEFYATT